MSSSCGLVAAHSSLDLKVGPALRGFVAARAV
jgi:hypothetical protein